jgi:CubicO group peptidase (beta-lactamase class C family)
MSLPYSAGGLYSTTEDLLLWEEGLYGGKLLSPSSIEKMTTPFLGAPAKDYAFGVAVTLTPSGEKTMRHGGSIEGFDSWMVYGAVDKLAVIVLSNLNGKAAHELGDELGMIARNETASPDASRQ